MGMKMLVSIDFPENHLQAIAAAAGAHGYEAVFCKTDEEAMEHTDGAEIIFGFSRALAEAAPELKWMNTPSAGVNHLTGSEVFTSGKALLTNSSGAYGVTIAEHIVMVTLEMMRRQQEYTGIVERREWRRDLAVTSIKNARVTVLGIGDIGTEAAIRLRAFGPACMTGVSRSGKAAEGLFDRVITSDRLDDILPETDLLVMALPDTSETRRMIDAGRLAALPDGALIVNIGRGSAIDQAALEAELRSGRLRAALDVFEQEPIPQDDPIWDCPNLLITPHISGNMTLPYTMERIVQLFLENLENYCAGRPLERLVDMTRGY